MDYQYQLKTEDLNFNEAIKILKKRVKNKIEIGGINNTDQDCIHKVLAKLQALGIDVKTIQVDKTEYEAYISQAEYKSKYPAYYADNFHEKSLEHFLCFKVLNPQKDQVIVDLASEHSPIPEIYTRLTGCKSYSQDIMYEKGIKGNQIGGDAADMPVESDFFAAAIATCSIEHFENNSDILLMKELGRTLKKNGKFIIVPLYLYSEPACQTDPVYSVAGNVKFDENVTLFCAENWGNRHGRFYSPESLMERLIQDNPEIRFTVYYIKNTNSVSTAIYCRYMLVGEKTDPALP